MSLRARAGGPHGIVVVDKPRGPTSHDIVQQARRLFRTRRVGHAGTLDPMATGVLVLLLGEATKLSEIATAADKTYRACVSFGRATDSYDADGRTTAEGSLSLDEIPAAELARALDHERSRSLQVPPAVSAIKLQGRRAHELVRRGDVPELAARAVSVRELRVLERRAHELIVELRVSKGYYVRALARDLGLALGVPAHLSELRRLLSGAFSLDDAHAWPPAAAPEPLPLAPALARLVPILRLRDAAVGRARAGQILSEADFLDGPMAAAGASPEAALPTVCAWTDPNGSPIALASRVDGVWRVRRGFAAELSSLDPEASKAEA